MVSAKQQVRLPRRGAALGLVFAGGAVGTATREAITLEYPALGGIPVATGAINVVGSLALGLLLGILASGGSGFRRGLRLVAGTGFCGGFTTYSTLSEQAANLVGNGAVGSGLLYALGTLVIGALAAWLGIVCGTAVARRRAVHGAVTSGDKRVPGTPTDAGAAR